MADKKNPFAHLMPKLTAPVTPKVEEKKSSESANQGLTMPAKSDSSFSQATQTKEQTQMLTPQAQLLLGSGGKEEVLGPDAGDAGAPEQYESNLNELGSLNTENMEAVTERTSNLNKQAASMTQRLLLDSAASVRELCDKLDAKINAMTQFVGPDLIEVRNGVQSLMVTLKQRPEFDSVIIDKDVRNVLTFIRSTRQEALALREVKTEKRAVRQIKREVAKDKTKGLSAAFDAIVGGGNFGGLT